jgi:hypothetical protein
MSTAVNSVVVKAALLRPDCSRDTTPERRPFLLDRLSKIVSFGGDGNPVANG